MVFFATVIGILAVVFSFLAKVVGHPDQMLKNYRRKSTEGVAISMFITSFLAYLFYTIHGVLQKDGWLFQDKHSGWLLPALFSDKHYITEKRRRVSQLLRVNALNFGIWVCLGFRN